MKATNVSRSDNVVFILGAGASAQNGLPVMAKFLSTAQRRFFDDYRDQQQFGIARDNLDQLLQFKKECQRSAWAFNRDWENIEELYTQADLCRIAERPDKAASSAICDAIAWAIWDIYRTDDEQPTELARAFHVVRNQNLIPAVITTNYDLLVERSLRAYSHVNAIGHCYYPGFGNQPIERAEGQLLPFAPNEHNQIDGPSSRRIAIAKLHGSVNWFMGEEQCYAYLDPGLCRHEDKSQRPRQCISSKLLDRSWLIESLQNTSASLAKVQASGITPAIVPPMLGKSSNNPAITHQWNAAISLLRSARQVWIVGYSFPQTDSFMPRLLCEGLYDNDDLEFIAIVNVEERSAFEARLRAIFNPVLEQQHKLHYYRLPARTFMNNVGSQADSWDGAQRRTAQAASEYVRAMSFRS